MARATQLASDSADQCGMRRTGILLVGHGTRSQRGIEEFHRLAAQVARLAEPVALEPAFLELCQPTIHDGLARLVERGISHVIVLPLLLFAAGHAKRDIPAAVRAAMEALGLMGRVTSELASHLGCQPAILELSARRFAESLHGRDAVPASATCLLLVGRGSGDESATAEMHEFARLRSKLTPVADTHVAFLALAQPPVGDVLPRLAASNWRRIVVQPHLLLHGELYENLRTQVASMRCQHPGTDWALASYLAGSDWADEMIARGVLARASFAGSAPV